jgi:hypothetical protein
MELETEQAITEAREKHAALERELRASDQNMTEMQVAYKRAVETGSAEAALDQMDEQLFRASREITRKQIKLASLVNEIGELERAHAQAQREREDELNREEERAALEEAEELEALAITLTTKAVTHAQRLERLRDHCRQRGVAQIAYKLSNLSRRFEAIFRGGSINRAYEGSYVAILQSNIDAAHGQMNMNKTEERSDNR